jgi:hypothetical protein
MNATAQITRYIDGLADWRGKVIGQLRTLINNTAPALTEEWKSVPPSRSTAASQSAHRRDG